MQWKCCSSSTNSSFIVKMTASPNTPLVLLVSTIILVIAQRYETMLGEDVLHCFGTLLGQLLFAAVQLFYGNSRWYYVLPVGDQGACCGDFFFELFYFHGELP